jgi:hypothetical protein
VGLLNRLRRTPTRRAGLLIFSGLRSKAEAARLKWTGVVAGVLDLNAGCLMADARSGRRRRSAGGSATIERRSSNACRRSATCARSCGRLTSVASATFGLSRSLSTASRRCGGRGESYSDVILRLPRAHNAQPYLFRLTRLLLPTRPYRFGFCADPAVDRITFREVRLCHGSVAETHDVPPLQSP